MKKSTLKDRMQKIRDLGKVKVKSVEIKPGKDYFKNLKDNLKK